jgi:GNAT superfamily N-acetyltransferase
MAVKFEERDMTDKEYKREQAAFNEHGATFDNPPEKQERFGFVATDNGKFVGASSGLVQKDGRRCGKYFYLTDLLVEKEHRKKGYGKELLKLLEEKIKSLGVRWIWTWTASYEAESFYIQQGYQVFTRFNKFYPSGHSRVGLIRKL